MAHLAFGARPDILFPAVLTERQGSKFQVPHLISSVRIFFLASTAVVAVYSTAGAEVLPTTGASIGAAAAWHSWCASTSAGGQGVAEC